MARDPVASRNFGKRWRQSTVALRAIGYGRERTLWLCTLRKRFAELNRTTLLLYYSILEPRPNACEVLADPECRQTDSM